MCSAEPLNCTHRRARPRPRDVRGRLSVRVGAGGRRISSITCRSRNRCAQDIAFDNAAKYLACRSRASSTAFMTKVLIVDVHAEMYRDRLREKFPALQFTLFHNAKRSDRRSFRYRRDDHVRHRSAGFHARRRAAAEMDSIAGDRRRSFPALPVAQARRADHQRPRHPRPADARAGRLYDDGRSAATRCGRSATRRRISGNGGCGARCTARPRRSSAPASSAAPSASCSRRWACTSSASRARRARIAGFDEMIATDRLARRGAPRRLPHQHAAGERRQYRTVRRRGVRRHEADRLLHQRRPRPDRRRGGAARGAARAPHRRRRRWKCSRPSRCRPTARSGTCPTCSSRRISAATSIEYEDFIMPLIVDNMRLFLAGRQGEMRNIVVR